MNLRRAAALIFGLVGVLPLLLFVFSLSHFDLLGRTEAQVGIALAVLIAVLGYIIIQLMVTRISGLTRALERMSPAERTVTPGISDAATISGLGQVSELGEMAQAFSRMLADLRASTERLEDLVFKLGTLNEMVEMAAKIPKIQDLLADGLERTMRAVRARIGSIMLLDHERQTLRVVVARGLPDDVLGRAEVRVGEGIAGRVVQLGDPVLVEDIETDPRFGKPNDAKYGGGSFICMPLRVQNRVIGVVNLAKKEYVDSSAPTPPFSRTDLQFLNTLMTYTAYAVDNARLLEEAQQAAQRLNEVVADQQLRLTLAQQQMLQAAKLSALGELVAGVAHELNNPLAVLLGNVELLDEDVPEALRPRLHSMQESIKRAERIVQGLLTFARKRPLQRQQVQLAQLLDKVLDVAAADLKLGRIVVETHMAPNLPAIWADGYQLQQVLLNLVMNAKQAMDDVDGERRLRIRMERAEPDGVHISVEDSGRGVAPELLPTIFDPFVTTRGVRGTGLGLSISYGIIREHGGHISVESPPGSGARFSIELPVGAPAVETVAPAPRATSTPSGARVLLVEDDEAVNDIMRRHLEEGGFTPLNVVTAEEALKQLEAPVALVVCDFHLPGMDGLAFYREAVRRQPALGHRFVFITAGLLPESARQFFEESRVQVLHKPFSRQQLLEIVRATIA